MKHVYGHQPSVIRLPGPLTRLTPACSCGWRGRQVNNIDDAKAQRNSHQAIAAMGRRMRPAPEVTP